MRPYIKLYRDITENELYFSEKFTRMQAFYDLLIIANQTNNTWRAKGKAIPLKPGDLCPSQLTLAERWRCNAKTAHAILLDLQAAGLIEFQGNTATTVISIKEYWYVNSVKEGQEGEQTGGKIGEPTADEEADELVSTSDSISEIGSDTKLVTINDDDNDDDLKNFIDILIETELKKRKIPIRQEEFIKGIGNFWEDLGEGRVIKVIERVLWVHDHKGPRKDFTAYLLVSLREE